jgi:hypothetical protein
MLTTFECHKERFQSPQFKRIGGAESELVDATTVLAPPLARRRSGEIPGSATIREYFSVTGRYSRRVISFHDMRTGTKCGFNTLTSIT